MYVYVLQHASHEGPGTLGIFLESRGVDLVTFDLSCGNSLPARLGDAGAVLSLGGPMNVYEEERYPFLREEDQFLREAVRLGVPVLGICLGAQVLAKACGAAVTRAPIPEIGFSQVSLTPEGLTDPLFRGVGSPLDVFQQHDDMFAVPDNGVLLAEGDGCQNQAFRYGVNAYGLQFHIEVTRGMIEDWYSRAVDSEKILHIFDGVYDSLSATAHLIYINFLSLILQSTNDKALSNVGLEPRLG